MNTQTSNAHTIRDHLLSSDQQTDDGLRERVRHLEETCQTLRQQVETAKQQLLQTNKMAIVGEMMATVTHELNNPLNGVLGFAQLLMKYDVDDQVYNGLQKIESEAARAAQIVRKLLDFVRSHSPERQLVGVNQIITSMTEMRAHHRYTNNIDLSLDLDAGLPPTIAEPHQLGQMILNLVANAEQAVSGSPSTGGIRIKTAMFAREGQPVIRIVIQDGGPGMPDKVRDRIFDPFFTTKRTGEGTGLGLAICRQIVEEHDGRIDVKSKMGLGTTFTIELPVRQSDDAAPKTAPGSTTVRKEVRSAKGLVIDDELVVREFVEETLVSEGHEIDAVSDGKMAFDSIKKKDYDFIICDLKMPDVNGQTFYDVVKNYDKKLSRRIIFITGDTANLNTEQFFQETGNYYIYKPFQLTDLIDLVNCLLTEQG